MISASTTNPLMHALEQCDGWKPTVERT